MDASLSFMEETAWASYIQEIRTKLSSMLKPSRYEHSLSVSFTSICLAMRYGADLRQAELAGLVHDCAKHLSCDALREACEKENIPLSEDLLHAPQVLHSVYGASYARTCFGIEDPDVLSAIYYHTLGRPSMSLLEAIVFTADYIEVRRDRAPRLPKLRRLAFTDLEQAVYEINRDTIQYLEASDGYICQASYETYRYYLKKMQERGLPL